MSDAEGSTIVEVCGICEYRMEFEDDGEGYGSPYSTYEYGALCADCWDTHVQPAREKAQTFVREGRGVLACPYDEGTARADEFVRFFDSCMAKLKPHEARERRDAGAVTVEELIHATERFASLYPLDYAPELALSTNGQVWFRNGGALPGPGPNINAAGFLHRVARAMHRKREKEMTHRSAATRAPQIALGAHEGKRPHENTRARVGYTEARHMRTNKSTP